MSSKHRYLSIAILALLGFTASPALAVEPHAGMLRYPDVSATHIAFVYSNDLWLVSRDGGTAVPLASPPGAERFPKFSPDGETIAFLGNYDGNSDIYTIPVSGGMPFRVTHHPHAEILTEWTGDGRIIFFAWGMATYPRSSELFTVSSGGGLPEQLPVPYGAMASIGPDGKWLAYLPYTRDHRTWKRYMGGMATDIWLFHLTKHTSRKITEWGGTDSFPMWHGDDIYYLSDAGPNHRLNIWVYNTRTSERKQVTRFADYDVKWPSVGPSDIVFQMGPDLYLLDLDTGKARTVQVTIPGDRPEVRVQAEDVSSLVFDRNISSTGKRAVVEARGDIWTLPAKKGSPVNLTRTNGIAERDPAWSPDGQWIAYFSDETGDYELYLAQSDGLGETRKLTDEGKGYLYDPLWSPDSKWVAFWDLEGSLYIHNVDKGRIRTIHRTPGGYRAPVSWSSDSNWLAFAFSETSRKPFSIWLYNVDKDKKHRVTEGMFNDTWPTFDREGKYLFFASERDFSSAMYDDYGNSFIHAHTDRLYLVPLKNDTPSPFAPESDGETWGEDEEESGDEDEDGEDGEDDKDKKKEPEPVEIDLEGFERRAVSVPVSRGNFSNLCFNDEGKLLYIRHPLRGTDDDPVIQLFDLDEEKEEEREKTVLAGPGGMAISGDGKMLLVVQEEGGMAIVEAKPEQTMENMISTDGMTVTIDPREEWRQIFHEAWRIHRDFFYDPNMHRVGWEGMREHYAAMLDDCASREDVGFIIGEMISELNVGHAYYFGGDYETPPRMSVGMLGCDFELSRDAYRISKIYEGGTWDIDDRGPLSQPGVDVKVGDYLLAVNGIHLDAAKDPWAAFQGLAGKTVTLTVSDKSTIDDDTRQVVVDLMDSDSDLRFRAWVEKSRAYVDEKSNGRVGYIYVPNTAHQGVNELHRQYVGQLEKEALIVDERWNGGGFVPTRMIELLNRPVANYWATRYNQADEYVTPGDAHHGPKCMLINGLAGSGGDYFPFWFRASGLGKLVGTRTWGGLVGMSGNPRLIDGGYTSVPTFAFYEKDGTWGIEGHGVDPDIEVVDDPALMADGGDPQLDAAIEHMLDEIRRSPYRAPDRPDYPDRSGMGIRPEDH
ncbi:MAG: PD40 domain-containing protein [Candidatus Eisenbacteria sp.]|nr:PD40 domain-containing protein [Candidatus Eisenbacteria bacterium]